MRVGPQGCKAKWVRIELKKVETLPGGGATNTFSDFVGPSPVNLWQSGEEYSMLPTVRHSTHHYGDIFLTTGYASSKISHSIFAYLSPFHLVLLWRKAVSTLISVSRESLLRGSVTSAGIRYDLVATVCVKGKKCVFTIALSLLHSSS